MAANSTTAVVLISSVPSTTAVEKYQKKIIDILTIKGIKHEQVDGAQAENRELRSKLWGIADQKPGTYPLVFLKNSEGEYEFVGDYEMITESLETEDFEQLFASVAKE